jgi:hypothetical protein
MRRKVLPVILFLIVLSEGSQTRLGAQWCNTSLSCQCVCAGEICDTCCAFGSCWIQPVGVCILGDCDYTGGGIRWQAYTMDTDDPGTCKWVCCVHEYATCFWDW